VNLGLTRINLVKAGTQVGLGRQAAVLQCDGRIKSGFLVPGSKMVQTIPLILISTRHGRA
jgi:hypothetical protein